MATNKPLPPEPGGSGTRHDFVRPEDVFQTTRQPRHHGKDSRGRGEERHDSRRHDRRESRGRSDPTEQSQRERDSKGKGTSRLSSRRRDRASDKDSRRHRSGGHSSKPTTLQSTKTSPSSSSRPIFSRRSSCPTAHRQPDFEQRNLLLAQATQRRLAYHSSPPQKKSLLARIRSAFHGAVELVLDGGEELTTLRSASKSEAPKQERKESKKRHNRSLSRKEISHPIGVANLDSPTTQERTAAGPHRSSAREGLSGGGGPDLLGTPHTDMGQPRPEYGWPSPLLVDKEIGQRSWALDGRDRERSTTPWPAVPAAEIDGTPVQREQDRMQDLSNLVPPEYRLRRRRSTWSCGAEGTKCEVCRRSPSPDQHLCTTCRSLGFVSDPNRPTSRALFERGMPISLDLDEPFLNPFHDDRAYNASSSGPGSGEYEDEEPFTPSGVARDIESLVAVPDRDERRRRLISMESQLRPDSLTLPLEKIHDYVAVPYTPPPLRSPALSSPPLTSAKLQQGPLPPCVLPPDTLLPPRVSATRTPSVSLLPARHSSLRNPGMHRQHGSQASTRSPKRLGLNSSNNPASAASPPLRRISNFKSPQQQPRSRHRMPFQQVDSDEENPSPWSSGSDTQTLQPFGLFKRSGARANAASQFSVARNPFVSDKQPQTNKARKRPDLTIEIPGQHRSLKATVIVERGEASQPEAQISPKLSPKTSPPSPSSVYSSHTRCGTPEGNSNDRTSLKSVSSSMKRWDGDEGWDRAISPYGEEQWAKLMAQK